jgi:hypothetical protein
MLPPLSIFLDDLRPAPVGWILARTAEQCLEILTGYQGVAVSISLSLDHDLGDDSQDEKHGYWFVKQIIERNLIADVIYLHSSNPVGRENMRMYLFNAIKHGALPPHVDIRNCPPPGYLENIEDGWYDKEV